MKLLITEAKIIDPQSPYNGKTCDILIENGVYRQISASGKGAIAKKAGIRSFSAKGCILSPGWLDLYTNFCDPGFEFREDIESGSRAALYGGFTAVCTVAGTHPVVQSKSEVEYILGKSQEMAVDVYPIGAITRHMAGQELSEMYDMHRSGAVAFCDGETGVQNSGIMLRALMYAKGFNGLIISRAHDKELAGSAMVNESRNTTLLGFKGIPSIAEELMVARDIELVRYSGARLHFSKISTAASVNLIRKAKKEKLPISCDVSLNNLLYTDELLNEFNSNYKLLPPLRNESDRKALIKGLQDGSIDAICSDHQPGDPESKAVEFDYAAYGAIGLQTAFALLNTELKQDLSLELLVEKMAVNPRRLLNLEPCLVQEDETASFSIFDPKMAWTFDAEHNQSRSANSASLGKTLQGKAVAVANKGQFIIL